MKTKETEENSGFVLLIFVVFLILKLTNVIDWSWWWVTSPLWLPTLIIIGAGIIGVVAIVIGNILKKL